MMSDDVPNEVAEVPQAGEPAALNLHNFRQVAEQLGCGDVTAANLILGAVKSGHGLTHQVETIATALIDCQRKILSAKIRVVLPGIGSNSSMELLRKSFPNYNLVPGNDYDDLGHPVARAARLLDFVYIVKDMLKAPSEFRFGKNYNGERYNVLIKDVGGDVRPYLNEKVSSFHVCRPILDAADVSRMDNLSLYMSNNGVKLLANRQTCGVMESMLSGGNDHMCSRPAQYCTTTAPNVLFLHSSYNIALADVAAIMDRASAERGYAVMHFHPMILASASSGRLPNIGCTYKKVVKDCIHYITFSFDGDPQLSYTHRLDTYLALVQAHYITSVSGTTMFVVERIRQNALCTLYIKLTRVRTDIQAHDVSSNLGCLNDLDHVYLHTYRYDTFFSGVTGDLIPVVYYVNKVYMNRLLAYASNLTTGKFVVQNVELAAHAMNTRTVVGGASGPAIDPLDTLVVKVIAYSVYIMVYIANWEGMKAMESLRSDEDRVRSAAISTCASMLANSIKAAVKDAFNFTEVEIPVMENETPVCAKTTMINSFLLGMLRRKNTVRVSDFPQTLTISAVIPAYVALEQRSIAAYCRIPAAVELDVSPATGFTPLKLQERAANVERVDCDLRLFPRNVPGDGNCFFYSVIAILDLPVSPTDIRKRLLRSVWLEALQDKEAISQRLVASGVDGWVNSDIVVLFAREYNVAVCVHATDSVVRYNSNAAAVVHLQLADNHFSPLFSSSYVHERDICMEHSSAPCRYAIHDYDNLLTPLLATADRHGVVRYNAGQVRTDCKNASLVYHPLCQLRGLTYSSGYAMLLHAAINANVNMSNRFAVQMQILDISSKNGSSVQYFVDGGHHVVRSVTDGKREQLCSNRYDCVSMTDFLSDPYTPGGYNLVSINPHYTDEVAKVSVHMHVKYLLRVRKSIDLLVDQGDMLIAVPMSSDNGLIEALDFYASHFTSCYFVRAKALVPHTPWVMMVCRNKRPVRNSEHISVLPTLARLWYACIDSMRQSITSIKSAATHKNFVPERLTSFDYNRISQSFLKRREDRGGAKSSGESPHWLPRFDEHFLETLGVNMDILDTEAGFRGIVRSYSSTVSKLLVEHLITSTGLTAPLADAEAHALVQAALAIHKSSFMVTFIRSLYVNIVENHYWGVVFALNKTDFALGIRLNESHINVPGLLQRFTAQYTRRPVIRNDENAPVTAMFHTALQRTYEVDAESTAERRRLVGDDPRQQSIDDVVDQDFPPIVGGDKTHYPIMRDPNCQQIIVKEHDDLMHTVVKEVLNNYTGLIRRVRTSSSEVLRRTLAGDKGVSMYLDNKLVCGPAVKYRPVSECEHRYCFVWDHVGKVDLIRTTDIKDHRNLLFTEVTKIFTEYDFSQLAANKYVDVDLSRVGIVQAAAGCGKSTTIVRMVGKYINARTSFLVLVSTKEGATDLAERIRLRYPEFKPGKQVTTIDSYCMHNRNRADYVFVDEALMQMPGRLLRTLSWAQPKAARLFGDRLQVPFVNRCPTFEVRYPEASRVFRLAAIYDLSYRSPADVAMVLSGFYLTLNSADGFNIGMRSASDAQTPSMSYTHIGDVSGVPRETGVKYLTFTQADKDSVKNTLRVDVSTVHEYQGKEAEHIILVRLTRDEGDNIYVSLNHCVTAVTRHRKTFRYYTCGPNNDLTCQLVKRARSATTSAIDAVRAGNPGDKSLPTVRPAGGCTALAKSTLGHLSPRKGRKAA